MCLALVFAVKKLRHYLLSHQVKLISKADPLKFLLKQPALSGRLGKWALLLMEFDITYVPRKAIKGQGMADFLAAHPIPEESPLNTELLDEETLKGHEVHEADIKYWKLYFDGASRTSNLSGNPPTLKAGIGIVLVSPEGGILHTSCALEEPCTNNEAEYEALIVGLEVALDIGVRCIQVYGDSLVVIRQILGIYDVRKEELVAYHAAALRLKDKFYLCEIHHIKRSRNS